MNIEAIILSKTSDIIHYGHTCRTINSLNASNDWSGNIIVVESEDELNVRQQGFVYYDCLVVFPREKFNYNRFLNIGIENLKKDTEWILICNNDLYFTPLWWKNMKLIMEQHPEILSYSPIAPSWHLHSSIINDPIQIGYDVSKHVCGWCILVHRSVITSCNLFDEQFEFWYQDNDYSEELKLHNVKHALVPSSKVYHMISASHDLLNEKKYSMTHAQQEKFLNKWKRNI